jgi:hypothetical protein
MAKPMTGVVVAKDFLPPPGAPPKYWCYLTVETDSGTRVKIRVHQSEIDAAVVGDRVSFSKPGRGNKRVKGLTRV